MSAKAVLVICASAFFAQAALGQCVSRITAPITPCRNGLGFGGLAYDGFGPDGVLPRLAGCGAVIPTAELTASYGGGLSITSSSCAAPTGLAVNSENAYDGPVAVAGNLPFLGTAATEGMFSTGGSGVISYGCGDGIVAITAEGPFDAAIAPASQIASPLIAPNMAPWGYKGIPNNGCGCGASYLN